MIQTVTELANRISVKKIFKSLFKEYRSIILVMISSGTLLGYFTIILPFEVSYTL